jgi:hypothetical protein
MHPQQRSLEEEPHPEKFVFCITMKMATDRCPVYNVTIDADITEHRVSKERKEREISPMR